MPNVAPPTIQGWHALTSLEMIRGTSEAWVTTLRSPGIVKAYIAGMTLLTIVFGFVTYTLDIRPSAVFGWHLARELASTSEWMTPALLAGAVILLSITPNLLEFTAGGLAAHGNLVAATAVAMSLAFDAVTDTPAAYAIGQAAVSFFLPNLAGIAFTVLSGLVALPILLFNTFLAEVLLFTFAITTFLLIRRHTVLPKTLR